MQTFLFDKSKKDSTNLNYQETKQTKQISTFETYKEGHPSSFRKTTIKERSFSHGYLLKANGSLIITNLPEQHYIEVNKLPNKIKVLNEKEVERFERYRNRIKELVIRIPYYYKKCESQIIGESNIYIPYNDTYINLENKAIDYFKGLNLYPIKTIVKIGNKIHNVFHLALNINKYDFVHTRPELGILRENAKRTDLQQFGKFIIGMPDLFVIGKLRKELFFCEVKSRMDKIRDHQKLWFLKNIVDFQTEVRYNVLKF